MHAVLEHVGARRSNLEKLVTNSELLKLFDFCVRTAVVALIACTATRFEKRIKKLFSDINSRRAVFSRACVARARSRVVWIVDRL